MPPKEPYDYFKSMLDGTAHKVYIELTSAAESSQYTSNLRKERKGSPRTATIIELLSWENTYLPSVIPLSYSLIDPLIPRNQKATRDTSNQ